MNNDENNIIPEQIGSVTVANMTLRDYFAACAMQGMYAGHAVNTFGESGRYAEAAYQIADAMLAERAK